MNFSVNPLGGILQKREVQLSQKQFRENLWGYGKRLQFVDAAMQREFPGKSRAETRVLDVGCGNGSQLAIPLADAGYQVTGVDPHQPSIERGRSQGSNVRFVCGAVSDVIPNHFDCVIISEVLEHLSTPEHLLAAALACIGTTGLLIVTVPNGYGEFELDRQLYNALKVRRFVDWLRPILRKNGSRECLAGSDDQSPHVQKFTLSGLRKIFDRHRLIVIESRGMSLISGPFVAHFFGKSDFFIRLNAAAADNFPMVLVAGWMFALKRAR
jgi:SAM-dependent methyltransferase